VDAIVIAKPENHWQSMAEPYNPALTGDVRLPLSTIEPIPLNERKIVCRRAAMEFIPQAVINFGIGMPDGVASVVAEEGFIDILTATVEPGVIGGVPCGGLRFGCAVNPLAIIDHPSMFDFYDGGGLDIAFLGMGELDQYGNVNVSKFGPRIPGPGGFVNITQASKSVVFCGTFTASGLQVDIKDSQLKIISEGQVKKLVPKVEHITFSGEYAREKGQKVVYVTERAVFAIQSAGLTLIEIAPGVDLDKDVVGQMGFSPRIAADLKRMDARIFRESPMGIKNEILAKAR
jgi:propionate CoA-transferase